MAQPAPQIMRDSSVWPLQLYETLKRYRVAQIAYVPDAGHKEVIEMAHADPGLRTTVLTTEEEGVALVAGAWLGGDRGVVLMQSSGVGNCINMFSLVRTCRFPFLAFVTMRGEWGEFNSWQVPMGQTTEAHLALAGLHVMRADRPNEVAEIADAACASAFEGGTATVVLLGQRLIGRKSFLK